MISDDLAGVIAPPPPGAVRYGQGTIIEWDLDTFENVVEWRGQRLVNLPVLAGITALSFRPGQAVGLLGWDAAGRAGATTWWILGRLVIPGGQIDSEVAFDTLTARFINVDRVEADHITLGGENLRSILQGLQAAVAGGDLGNDPEPDPEPGPSGTITRTYNAQWSANYRGISGLPRNTFDERPHQGFWSSLNGNQRSLIRFPSSTIQSDHSGRTVTRVRVYLYAAHWNFNSGGTAILGHHGHGSSPPSTFSATTDQVRSEGWPKPGGRWVTYNVGMQDWVTGSKTGIALGPGPSTNKLYYGRFRGVGESNAPRLEIRSTT